MCSRLSSIVSDLGFRSGFPSLSVSFWVEESLFMYSSYSFSRLKHLIRNMVATNSGGAVENESSVLLLKLNLNHCKIKLLSRIRQKREIQTEVTIF